MFLNLGRISDKDKRRTKFGFPFSLNPNYRNPEPVPTDKRLGEVWVAGMYCGMIHNYRTIERFRSNSDDSNKGADIIMIENARELTVQISRLTFNNFPQRKKISQSKGRLFAELIYKEFPVQTNKVLIRIMPEAPCKIPLENLKFRNKEKLQKKLLDLVVSFLKESMPILKSKEQTHTQHWIRDQELKKYFSSIDIQIIEPHYHSHLPHYDKIYIDYYFYNSFYNKEDMMLSIDRMYEQKNGGKSEMLIIWANYYELFDGKEVADALIHRFQDTTFKEVYFMAFHETTHFWVIKRLTT